MHHVQTGTGDAMAQLVRPLNQLDQQQRLLSREREKHMQILTRQQQCVEAYMMEEMHKHGAQFEATAAHQDDE